MAQNDKKFSLLHFISQESYIIWFSFMVHLCEVTISQGSFFHFFKILIFWVVRGVKGQKMVQNKRKFCLSQSISQQLYIIWFSFMVHMCKIIISMGIFKNFSKLWFFRLLGSKGKKNGPKWQKLCLSCFVSQEPYIVWSSFMVHMCNRINLQGFFYFFLVFIFGVNSGVKGQKIAQNDKKLCLSYTISQEAYIIQGCI